MSVQIGNNNTIKNSVIAGTVDGAEPKKKWAERHPVITGFLISFGAGLILMFSFWDKVITFIENLF